MKVAKISSKGQITIPVSIRKALRLRNGGKVVIQEENGRYFFDNMSLAAFAKVEEDFSGAAKEAGFNTEEEMQKYMEDIRREVRGY